MVCMFGRTVGAIRVIFRTITGTAMVSSIKPISKFTTKDFGIKVMLHRSRDKTKRNIGQRAIVIS